MKYSRVNKISREGLHIVEVKSSLYSTLFSGTISLFCIFAATRIPEMWRDENALLFWKLLLVLFILVLPILLHVRFIKQLFGVEILSIGNKTLSYRYKVFNFGKKYKFHQGDLSDAALINRTKQRRSSKNNSLRFTNKRIFLNGHKTSLKVGYGLSDSEANMIIALIKAELM